MSERIYLSKRELYCEKYTTYVHTLRGIRDN